MGLADLGSLGAQSLLQYADIVTAKDTVAEHTAPLFKQRSIGVPSPSVTYKWRSKVDTPTHKSWLMKTFAPGTKRAYKEKTMLSHTKLANIIYRNGHSMSPTTKTAGAVTDLLLKNPLLPLGAGLAAYTMGREAINMYSDRQKAMNSYTEMFNKFPSLAAVEPSKIDDYWNIMREYSPAMTHNPIVAGQFIKNMVDFGMEGIDHPTLKSLLDVQASKNKAFTGGSLTMADVARIV